MTWDALIKLNSITRIETGYEHATYFNSYKQRSTLEKPFVETGEKEKLIQDFLYSHSLGGETANNYQSSESTPRKELTNFLTTLSIDQIKGLHKVLVPLFTSQVENHDRLKIIKIFYSIVQDNWNDLAKQIHFLIPQLSWSSDLELVAKILVSISDKKTRNLLVQTTNSCFDWRMTPHQRIMTLLSLRGKTIEELNKLNSSLEAREKISKAILETYKT